VRQVEQNFYELIFGRLRDALESQIVELRVFVHYLHLKLKVVVKLLEVFSNHKIFLKILLLLLQTKHVEHLSRQLDELEKTIELISEKISRRVNPKLKHKFVSFFSLQKVVVSVKQFSYALLLFFHEILKNKQRVVHFLRVFFQLAKVTQHFSLLKIRKTSLLFLLFLFFCFFYFFCFFCFEQRNLGCLVSE
jgi:hypothetical protein